MPRYIGTVWNVLGVYYDRGRVRKAITLDPLDAPGQSHTFGCRIFPGKTDVRTRHKCEFDALYNFHFEVHSLSYSLLYKCIRLTNTR